MMIEYKYKKRENKFTENGHTMFEFDVLQRLKRLAHLEEQMKQGQSLPKDSITNCFECGEHIKPELFVKGENNQCGECHYK